MKFILLLLLNYPAAPQANHFSSVKCSAFSKQIYKNSSAANFTYNSYDDLKPACFSSGIIVPLSCVPGNGGSLACPPSITGSTVDKKIKLNNISAQLSVLENKIDGGNTQNLLNAIINQPDGQMKNSLMSASPYLSDNVLIAYSNTPTPGKKAVAPGNYKQVIIANSPVTSEVKTAIDNRYLPSGIRQQIDSAQVGISERQMLEQQITLFENEKQLLTNAIAADYLDSGFVDSVVLFLELQNTLNSKITLIPILASTDTTKAMQNIAAIRDSAIAITSTNPQLASELNSFADYYTLAIPLAKKQGSYFAMSSAEEQQLRTIANSNTAVAINAQSILSLVFNEQFDRFAELLDANPNARMAGNTDEEFSPVEKIINTEGNSFVKVYPNPANESFVLEYKLPDNSKEAFFIMYDMLGDQVVNLNLKTSMGKEQFNISTLTGGLYYYTIIANNNSIARDKLVVIKR